MHSNIIGRASTKTSNAPRDAASTISFKGGVIADRLVSSGISRIPDCVKPEKLWHHVKGCACDDAVFFEAFLLRDLSSLVVYEVAATRLIEAKDPRRPSECSEFHAA